MNSTRCTFSVGTALLLAGLVSFGTGAPASAEVSVNTSASTLFFQAEPGSTWARHRRGVASHRLLNPLGDERGDGMPSIARNPVTDAWEVAWARAGAAPAVMFAHYDVVDERWVERAVPQTSLAGNWAGRVVDLVHDEHGNRYISYHDSESGSVLLASAPRDSALLNRPILLNLPGALGSRPSLLCDGEALIIAYAKWDGGLDVVRIRPVLDDQGRIPNAGIGIPGIPEPRARIEVGANSPSVPLGSVGTRSLVTAPTLPGPGTLPGDGAAGDQVRIPPMVQLETIDDDRLLATWLENEKQLGYAARIDGAWSFSGALRLEDPVEHEKARAEARRLLGSCGRMMSRGLH